VAKLPVVVVPVTLKLPNVPTLVMFVWLAVVTVPTKLAPVTTPVTLTVVPVWLVAEMLPTVALPVALIVPPVTTLPNVPVPDPDTAPVALIGMFVFQDVVELLNVNNAYSLPCGPTPIPPPVASADVLALLAVLKTKSLILTTLELIVVVVPWTVKLPVMITLPSVPPDPFGSMVNVGPSLTIKLPLIRTLPITAVPAVLRFPPVILPLALIVAVLTFPTMVPMIFPPVILPVALTVPPVATLPNVPVPVTLKLPNVPTLVMFVWLAVASVPVKLSADKLPTVTLPVALINPPVKILPPVMLPVVLTVPPAGGAMLATIVVALIVPLVTMLPPVMFPVELIVLVEVIACESLMTVVPLILIAIFVFLYLCKLG